MSVHKHKEYFVRNDEDLVAVGKELTRQAVAADAAHAAAPGAVTREELFALHTSLCLQAHALMRKKNADYSKAGPFMNLRYCEGLGISAEVGVLVRLGDKIARLNTLASREAAVSDESIDDTVLDIINYAVCVAGLLKERGRKQ